MRRLTAGEVVVASDGAGRWRRCLVDASPGRRPARALSLEPDGEIVTEERATPALTVALSLPKGDRGDWAVAKLAELGVDRIVPVRCERTVLRHLEEGQRLGRLARIVREAAMQSRACFLPELTAPVDLGELLATAAPATVALCEPGGGALTLATPCVVVGPEGGFSPAELAGAAARGAATVGLGPTVLRVETAAVAAGALLAALRSGTIGPSAATLSAHAP